MGKTILVIDDEPDVLRIVRAVLNTKGHQVITAGGGEEGLAEAERNRPDLIICDLMMPRVSGLEVIKRLKANQRLRRIPILILSALGDSDDRPPEFWVRTLGIDDYVQKPFDPLDLLGRVEYLFRRAGYVSSQENQSDTDPARPDADTQMPVDLKEASPEDVVRAFVESWNRQDFATEYQCLAEEMTGQMDQHDYVGRRRATYMEEKGQSRWQRIAEVGECKVSVNVARVNIKREDTVNGNTVQRQETYMLRKTASGWKIMKCQSTRL